MVLPHLFPSSIPKFLPQSGFCEIPMWLAFCHLPLSRRRQAEDVLSSVSSGFDANPTLLPHPVQGARQRGAIHYKAFAQPFLIHLAGYCQCRQQSELCDLEARLFQLLVINPRHNPGCAPKGLAGTRQVKERFGGGRFECLSLHNICIYIWRFWSSNSLRVAWPSKSGLLQTTGRRRALVPNNQSLLRRKNGTCFRPGLAISAIRRLCSVLGWIDRGGAAMARAAVWSYSVFSSAVRRQFDDDPCRPRPF